MARGRRPGKTNMRGTIVETARRMFQEQGYAGVSLRAVAREAGVDPSLVHHYFQGKSELFSESILGEAAEFSPQDVVRSVLAEADPADYGRSLVLNMVRMWDQPGTAEAIRANLLSLGEQDLILANMQEVVADVLGGELEKVLDTDRPRFRAALAVSQMIGLAMSRFVLVENSPVATMTPEELSDVVGPTIQRYLTADL